MEIRMTRSLRRARGATTRPGCGGTQRGSPSGMIGPLPFSLFVNPRAGTPGIVVLPSAGFRRAKAAITSWPEYAPTPLRDLPEIARGAGVAAVRLKDEAGRFGLGSFKALGGAYAVAELLRGRRE